MRAADLFAKGVSQADIGRELEVSHQTVSDWHEKWTAGGDLESDTELEHVLTQLAFLHATSRERGLRVTVSEHVGVVTLKRYVIGGGELLEVRQRSRSFLELRTGGSEVFEDLLHLGTCFGEACVILVKQLLTRRLGARNHALPAIEQR